MVHGVFFFGARDIPPTQKFLIVSSKSRKERRGEGKRSGLFGSFFVHKFGLYLGLELQNYRSVPIARLGGPSLYQ
jgi:hypothetical protein